MFRYLLLVPFLLLFQESLWGQDTYKEYELIRFEASPDESVVWIIRRQGDGFRPKFDTYHQFYKTDKGLEFSKTKNVCVWVAPPGKYDVDTIILTNGALSMEYKQITISGTTPTPVPPNPSPTPPNPNPNPNPPNPVPPNPTPPNPQPGPAPEPGKLGYSKLAYDVGVSQGVSKETAKALADNYQAVSAAIRAGGIVDVQKAFNEVSSRNATVLSSASDKAKWDVWFDKLEEKISSDWDSNKISNRDDVAQVFKEISVGLSAL